MDTMDEVADKNVAIVWIKASATMLMDFAQVAVFLDIWERFVIKVSLLVLYLTWAEGFSDQNVVVVVVGVVVNFSHFHLLQNHWANFNQTWHKASLGEGNSSLMKSPHPFPRGEIYEIEKYIEEIKNL